MVRALAAHRPVDVVYQEWGAPEPSAEWQALESVELHPIKPSKGLRRAAIYAHRRATRVPERIARSVSYEFSSGVKVLAAVRGRGRVIADGLYGAGAVLPLAARRPVIYDAHNLNWAFRHRVGTRGLGRPARFRAFERRLFKTMAETWMVSRQDIDGGRLLAPAARFRYVPNVIDLERIRPVEARAGAQRVLFVGQFSYPPNKLAVRFLLDEVMPRVWQRRPNARLTLAGKGLDSANDLDERVEARGYVEDLDNEYRRADCAVVPLLEGGGTPLKFLEAMAYSLPVVATPHAAAGLTVRPGTHYMPGADAPSFADAIVACLGPDAAKLGRAARELVAHEYSIGTLTRLLAPGA